MTKEDDSGHRFEACCWRWSSLEAREAPNLSMALAPWSPRVSWDGLGNWREASVWGKIRNTGIPGQSLEKRSVKQKMTELLRRGNADFWWLLYQGCSDVQRKVAPVWSCIPLRRHHASHTSGAALFLRENSSISCCSKILVLNMWCQ